MSGAVRTSSGAILGEVFASPSGGLVVWVASTYIPSNQLVSNGGANYICKTAHTSTGTFDATKFTALSSSGTAGIITRHIHPFVVSGNIVTNPGSTDANGNYLGPFYISLGNETSNIVKVRYSIGGGTSVTFKLQKNGVDLTGFTGMSATTTVGSVTPTAQPVIENDAITLVVTAVSGSPVNLSATLVQESTIT